MTTINPNAAKQAAAKSTLLEQQTKECLLSAVHTMERFIEQSRQTIKRPVDEMVDLARVVESVNKDFAWGLVNVSSNINDAIRLLAEYERAKAEERAAAKLESEQSK